MDLHEKDFIVDVSGALKKSGIVSIILAPKYANFLSAQLRKRDIAYSVQVANLQELIDAEEKMIASRTNKAYDPSAFNTLEDNYAHMQASMDACPAGLTCSISSAGNSYEGRPINIYKLSTGGTKPIVWIDSTIHAREWLATTTNVRMFDYVMAEYGNNGQVTDLLDKYDFWFLPIGNPDGYSYSWTNERMYRKNRRPQAGGCIGVDLNRNFDFRHCLQGASTNPCSDTFCGPSGASEPETQAYQNAISAVAGRMTTMITIHSYGQMWMHPWGNTVNYGSFSPCERADDHNDMYVVAQAAADAIFQTTGRRWDYGTSCEVIYATTGATDDWSKGAVGVKYSFNPELRGSNFIVPTSEIEPSFREVWSAVVAVIAKIEEIEGVGYPLNK